MSDWPQGYQLVVGSELDRSQLLATVVSAYTELGATRTDHFAKTVELYLAGASMVWWLEPVDTARVGFIARRANPIGCLWLGQSTHQLTGVMQAYIYLVYVAPEHRRQGLGRKLMNHARNWALDQGYEQLGLQVFTHNVAAIKLYESLGYRMDSTFLTLGLR